MKNRLAHRLLSCMLSALVLTTGAVRPATQHAHEGGDDPSHHHHSTTAYRGHSHDKGATHSDHSGLPTDPLMASQTNAGCSLFSSTSHLHFKWLGIELTIPGHNGPTGEEKQRSSVEIVFTRVVRCMTPAPQPNDGDGKVLFAGPSVALATSTSLVPTATGHCGLPVATSPLCDRARHERSGVLLA